MHKLYRSFTCWVKRCLLFPISWPDLALNLCSHCSKLHHSSISLRVITDVAPDTVPSYEFLDELSLAVVPTGWGSLYRILIWVISAQEKLPFAGAGLAKAQ